MNWRKTAKAVHQGTLTQFIPENDVYVYFRILGDEKIMVVLNNSTTDQTLDLTRFREVLPEASNGLEILSDRSIQLEETLEVSAKTPLIIQLN